MRHLRSTLLGAALLCGALSLSPQAAQALKQPTSAPAPHGWFFPAPSEGLVIRAKDQTLGELLDDFARVTGEHILHSEDTGNMLDHAGTMLRSDLEVPAELVYEVVQDILIQAHFVLTDVRRREPRMLSISSLDSPARATIKQHARYVDAEHVEQFAQNSAFLITTTLYLPNMDVRTMGASMRQLVVDPNTLQLIPIPESSSVIITGFGTTVHGLVQLLQRIDEVSGQGRELRKAEQHGEEDGD